MFKLYNEKEENEAQFRRTMMEPVNVKFIDGPGQVPRYWERIARARYNDDLGFSMVKQADFKLLEKVAGFLAKERSARFIEHVFYNGIEYREGYMKEMSDPSLLNYLDEDKRLRAVKVAHLLGADCLLHCFVCSFGRPLINKSDIRILLTFGPIGVTHARAIYKGFRRGFMVDRQITFQKMFDLVKTVGLDHFDDDVIALQIVKQNDDEAHKVDTPGRFREFFTLAANGQFETRIEGVFKVVEKVPDLLDPICKTYDYVVIGGGTDAIESARCARKYKVSVARIEPQALGGTSVNVGCASIKIKHNTSFGDQIQAHNYDFDAKFTSWSEVKATRDAYISSMNQGSTTDKDGVELISGVAEFDYDGTVVVNGQKYKGKNTLIAVGGTLTIPTDVSGANLGIDSDRFFELEDLPKKAVVVGAGYIALEIAGVLAKLDSETHMLIRYEQVLRTFDHTISEVATEFVDKGPITLHKKSHVKSVEMNANGTLKVTTQEGEVIDDVNTLIWAIGRTPLSARLNLDKVGVKTDSAGHIIVDEYQQTNVPRILSLGDVCGKFLPTPVAIAVGRRLSHRLFNGETDNHLKNDAIVLVYPGVFAAGLLENEAVAKFGKFLTHVYTKVTVSYNMKLITAGPEEKVVGIHMIGQGVDEMFQGFAVAVTLGGTKKDFDRNVASDPAISEMFAHMSEGVKL